MMKTIAFLPMHKLSLPFLVLLIFGLVPRCLGQMDQGSIVGTVLDSTGAAIANAKITLTNEQTGFILERTADGSGSYAFTPIKIGNYTVTASSQGFRSFEQRGVNVTAGSRVEVALTLGAASSDMSIEVSAAAPILQTQEASTGATFRPSPLSKRRCLIEIRFLWRS